jgi:16S rRNA (adenine1518-N6/adenine1519-N6)-dimethyltransferase
VMADTRVSPLCFTVQREVADRLSAPPGGKEYGPISVFAQAMAIIQRIARVPPEAFWPAPRVDSTMLRLDVREEGAPGPQVRRELARLVHGCFNHRRKTMRHNLQELLDQSQYQEVEASGRWDLTDRPERITVQQWVDLAQLERGGGEMER